jgi:arsenate reductase-like glutaredoxin family protein
VLDARQADVRRERSARKEPLSDKEVRELLRGVGTVILAKGRKAEKHAASTVRPADLKGPTGNYRAPMVRKGKTLLVGFNAEALESLV